MIRKEDKTAVIEANRTHATDTGSPEVQVAILTARIKELTGGVSFASNLQLAYNNARLAARVAKAYAENK